MTFFYCFEVLTSSIIKSPFFNASNIHNIWNIYNVAIIYNVSTFLIYYLYNKSVWMNLHKPCELYFFKKLEIFKLQKVNVVLLLNLKSYFYTHIEWHILMKFILNIYLSSFFLFKLHRIDCGEYRRIWSTCILFNGQKPLSYFKSFWLIFT